MQGNDQLIKGCLQQNRASQKELYQRFADTMLGVCYRYTKSQADAEDILQEGFVKVFKHLQQYRGEGELGAWIRRIMVTTALNYLKRNARYQGQLAFDDVALHPVADDDPGLALDTKELVGLIRQLPTGYQLIFNLHVVEGYTHVEIGQMLGINEGTSRSQYARARALLVTWIKKNHSDHKRTVYAQ
jgi:RNA polymerase sigma factor (sigma-70 family)